MISNKKCIVKWWIFHCHVGVHVDRSSLAVGEFKPLRISKKGSFLLPGNVKLKLKTVPRGMILGIQEIWLWIIPQAWTYDIYVSGWHDWYEDLTGSDNIEECMIDWFLVVCLKGNGPITWMHQLKAVLKVSQGDVDVSPYHHMVQSLEQAWISEISKCF